MVCGDCVPGKYKDEEQLEMDFRKGALLINLLPVNYSMALRANLDSCVQLVCTYLGGVRL